MPVRSKPSPTASLPTELRIYYGIDPGVGGGIAVSAEEINLVKGIKLTGLNLRTTAMPSSDRDLLDWLEYARNELSSFVVTEHPFVIKEMAVLEQVSGYIGKGHPGSHMFVFGASYGALRMALTARNISYETVNPLVWQRVLGVGNPRRTKGEKDNKMSLSKAATKSQHKAKLRAKAQQLFPQVKVTNHTADALLLMTYGIRHVFNTKV